MSQPDLNAQDPVDAAGNADMNTDAIEAQQHAPREWLPEDEDEWYEPDYRRERGT